MSLVKIFDLDGTVIDSHHRTEGAYINGLFSLDAYLAKCNSPQQIAKDTLLPLAKYMQACINNGEVVAIITARYLQQPDLDFLRLNSLVNVNTIILGRESVTKEVRALSDAEYKVKQLNTLKSRFKSQQRFVMFDDINAVLNRLSLEDNITMINAISLNSEIAYSEQVNTCELSNGEVVESRISSAEFAAFCTNQMIV